MNRLLLRIRLLLALAVAVASPFFAASLAAADATAPAVETATTGTTVGTVSASSAAGPGVTVLSNDLVDVEILDQRGAIRSMRLASMKTLPRHGWQLDGVAAVPPGQNVPVLGAFKPAGGWHGWLQFHEGDGGDHQVWTVQPGADRHHVELRYHDAADGLDYTITHTLAPEGMSLATTLVVTNASTAPVTLPLVIYPLTGVHQDDPTVDLRYVTVFRHYGGEGGGLKSWNLPGERVRFDIPVDKLDYLGLNSRFFITEWQPMPLTGSATPAAPAGPVSGGPAAPAGDAPAAAVNACGVHSAAAWGFLGDQQPAQAHQAFLQVVYDPLQLPPGGSATRAWATTITSTHKSDLAYLNKQQQEAEYTDSYYWFFKSLAQILMALLGILHSVLGSYGWSVVIMTFLLKLAMHHFTYKSQSSMLRMQQLAPELAALKNQYANDQGALGQAQLKLYAKHGINPVSGCLPALIQIPVFGALLMTFSHCADLRGQPFLWIHDLTQPDQLAYLGFNIYWFGAATINPMPLVYIAVNLAIALMTKPPVAANPDDPNAQMMQYMRWMPTVFGVFFYQFPSGLVLYYTLNSIATFTELRIIKWRLGIPH